MFNCTVVSDFIPVVRPVFNLGFLPGCYRHFRFGGLLTAVTENEVNLPCDFLWCFIWEQLSWPSIDEVDSTDGAEVQETESNEVQENGGNSSTVWMQAEAYQPHRVSLMPRSRSNQNQQSLQSCQKKPVWRQFDGRFFDVFCTLMWACLQSCEARYQWGVHVLLSASSVADVN